MNPFHDEILELIKKNSGKPTQHTYLDDYLGNSHPRYPINAPTLRTIAKSWMREHKALSTANFVSLVTSLIEGISSTEKIMAGILLGYSILEQRKFDPKRFDHWLDHLVGWAEVDAVCTGDYTITELPSDWKRWEPLLYKFAKSKNIHKRRASLVLLCSPVSRVTDERLAKAALDNVETLKPEKEILITKAISWLLRSMVKNYKKSVSDYIKEHGKTLPAIVVRETMIKIKTGKKTTKKI